MCLPGDKASHWALEISGHKLSTILGRRCNWGFAHCSLGHGAHHCTSCSVTWYKTEVEKHHLGKVHAIQIECINSELTRIVIFSFTLPKRGSRTSKLIQFQGPRQLLTCQVTAGLEAMKSHEPLKKGVLTERIAVNSPGIYWPTQWQSCTILISILHF